MTGERFALESQPTPRRDWRAYLTLRMWDVAGLGGGLGHKARNECAGQDHDYRADNGYRMHTYGGDDFLTRQEVLVY